MKSLHFMCFPVIAMAAFLMPASSIGQINVTAGGVGIGTTTPIRTLHLAGLGGAEFILEGSNGLADYRKWNFYIGGASGAQKHLFLRILNDAGNTTMVNSMIWTAGGNVGINTVNPTHKLTVNGQVKSKGFISDTSGWSDYVFRKDYKLLSLEEIERYIQENGHLPGIPSEKVIMREGVNLGEMQAKLLAQIEELTLRMIEQEKIIKAQGALLLEINKARVGEKNP